MRNNEERKGSMNAVQNKTILQPVIDWCSKHRGAKSKLMRSLINHGHDVTWSMVSGWLHTDPEKRSEPRLDVGLMMLEIFEQEIKPKKK